MTAESEELWLTAMVDALSMCDYMTALHQPDHARAVAIMHDLGSQNAASACVLILVELGKQLAHDRDLPPETLWGAIRLSIENDIAQAAQ